MRAVYVYCFGNGQYNLDLYRCKSGKDIRYLNARAYWVERLQNLMRYTGGNYYVEMK